MTLSKWTKDTAVIENVGTKPEDRTDLNNTTFKRKWDENATDWKEFWNDTASTEIDNLISDLEGKFDTYTTETSHYITYATRDLSTAGLQTIGGLPFAAKKITLRVIVDGAVTESEGVCIGTLSQICKYKKSDGVCGFDTTGSILLFAVGAWLISAKVTAITADEIQINWTIASGSPSGTAIIFLELDKH